MGTQFDVSRAGFEIVALCGASRSQIVRAVTQLGALGTWDEVVAFARRSRLAFEPAAEHRLTMVLRREDARAEVAAAALAVVGAEVARRAVERLGLFLASSRDTPRVAALFPGQGAEYRGMFRSVAASCGEVAQALRDAGQQGDEQLGLSQAMYGLAEAGPATRPALHRSDLAQPAVAALGVGLSKVLRALGVRYDATLGHGFGELIALCVAGRINETDLFRLARFRGRLMVPLQSGDGALLEVRADDEATMDFVRSNDLRLLLAGRDSASRTVVGGDSREVVRAASLAAEQAVDADRWVGLGAVHTPLMGEAADPFAAELHSVDFSSGEIPVYAGSTGRPYSDDVGEVRGTLAAQMVSPVDFRSGVEDLLAAGTTVFVEIGPGDRLGQLVAETAAASQARGVRIVSLDRSQGNRNSLLDLALGVAELAAAGCCVDLAAWPPEPSATGVELSANVRGLQGSERTLELPEGAEAPSPTPSSEEIVAPAPAIDLGTPTSFDAAADSATVEQPLTSHGLRTETALGSPIGQSGVDSYALPRLAVEFSPTSALGEIDELIAAGPERPDLLAEALRLTGESLASLARLQLDATAIHRRFLESQREAVRAFRALLERQHQILESLGLEAAEELEGEALLEAARLEGPHPGSSLRPEEPS